MSEFVKILQACTKEREQENDGETTTSTEIQLDIRFVPKKSYLYLLLSGESGVPVKRSESGAVVTSSSLKELETLKMYLETGKLDPESVSQYVEVLDYYGLVMFKTLSYPEEFVKVKLEEEWFRRNLYLPEVNDVNPEISSLTFRCIRVTDEILSSFTLMSNVHYLYPRRLYSSNVKHAHNPLSQLITKVHVDINQSETYTDLGSDHCLLHSFPRPYVKFTEFETVIDKIKTANTMFLDRDSEFDGSLIRESLRANRGNCNFRYPGSTCGKSKIASLESTIPLDWFNTTCKMLKRFKESNFMKLFEGMAGLFDGVLLAGGSVLNLILDCGLEVDYDLFFYNNTLEQANNKVREMILHVKSCKELNELNVTRTRGSVTLNVRLGWRQIKIQCILRSYKSISEVLHGFDVDCSCVGFDGSVFYLTERSKFALENMLNFVDFDRMSPTYEFRLAKYASRGFSTFIPDFVWKDEISEGVLEFIKEKREREGRCRENCRKGPWPEANEKNAELRTEFKKKWPAFKGIEVLIVSYFGLKLPGLYLSDYDFRGSGETVQVGNFEFNLNLLKEIISYTVDMTDRWGSISYSGEYVKIMIDNIFSLNVLDMDKVRIKAVAGKEFHDDTFDPGFKDYKFKLPMVLEWKGIEPGGQFTSTFHQLVLKDVRTWYKCRFER